jgi:hypothetical protein
MICIFAQYSFRKSGREIWTSWWLDVKRVVFASQKIEAEEITVYSHSQNIWYKNIQISNYFLKILFFILKIKLLFLIVIIFF